MGTVVGQHLNASVCCHHYGYGNVVKDGSGEDQRNSLSKHLSYCVLCAKTMWCWGHAWMDMDHLSGWRNHEWCPWKNKNVLVALLAIAIFFCLSVYIHGHTVTGNKGVQCVLHHNIITCLETQIAYILHPDCISNLQSERVKYVGEYL